MTSLSQAKKSANTNGLIFGKIMTRRTGWLAVNQILIHSRLCVTDESIICEKLTGSDRLAC